MLRNFIPYESANNHVTTLLAEEKTRIEKINLLELPTVLAYSTIVNKRIEKLNIDLSENLMVLNHHMNRVGTTQANHQHIYKQKVIAKTEREKIHAQLDTLNKLLFELDQQKIHLEHKNKNELFLMVTVLLDKVKTVDKKSDVEAVDEQKIEVSQSVLNVARESVTLEVLQNHDMLMDNMRKIAKEKEDVEIKMQDAHKEIAEHEATINLLLHQSQNEFLQLRKQLDEQAAMITTLQSDYKKNAWVDGSEKKRVEHVATAVSMATEVPAVSAINSSSSSFWRHFSIGK